jgi:hypothetical protein
MIEEQKIEIEGQTAETEIDRDVIKIMEATSPIIEQQESGVPKIILDYHGVKKALDDVKSAHETIVLESDLLGIRCTMRSKIKPIGELQKMAHRSMNFLMTHIPTKIPFGVG